MSSNPDKQFKEACKKLDKYSTDEVVEAFKNADPGVLERLANITWLPAKFAKKVDNEYLYRCIIAESAMDAAFDARGSGWASDVTEEGWKGYADYNKIAESNLLAAVKLRPNGAMAKMQLSRLAGSSCSSELGDAVSWCRSAISNSLDVCAEEISRFLHFQTSRWGGSTRFLSDFLMECATNVDTRSTFSYRGAAAAFSKILVAEADTEQQSAALDKYITPEMRKALYKMFDEYAAAPETPFMPSADVFRAMGMSFALQLGDWVNVRRYFSKIKKPVKDYYHDALWLLHTDVPAINNVLMAHFFEVLGQSAYKDKFLAAEELYAAGRYEEAFKAFSFLQQIKRPINAEKYLASERYYLTRRILEEKRGDWVNLMPSRIGGEAVHFWGLTYTDADGKARCHNNKRSYYRVSTPVLAVGSEFEGTIHFESIDKAQKVWNIGWGLGRLYSGFCSDNNSWAYPYIAFQRDDKGDRYSVQAFTIENEAKSKEKLDKATEKAAQDIGWFKQIEVAKGTLERKDSHTFNLKIVNDVLSISIDGKEVFTYTFSDMMKLEYMYTRIQPDGSALPVWKVFSGTAFSNYRYRRIKTENK